MKTILKNCKIITPNSNKLVMKNIYMDDYVICEPFKPDEAMVTIDTKNKYIIPGLVDLHVHFRDPGQTHKEDIYTGSMAAAKGGFTTVCAMPNTSPVVDSVDTIKYLDKIGKDAGYVDLLPVAAMTKEQNGTELCDFNVLDQTSTLSSELTGHGICAISEDGISLEDTALMEEVCRISKELDIPIMDHAEPEVEIISRDIELAKKFDCRIHIQHVSLRESVALIREAKTDGIAITCEATPHHFALDESALENKGTNAKMNPPLRTRDDKEAIIEGLLDDTIDIIATDHAPHTEEEKDVPFSQAPNGISGLETAFPISYTVLVKSRLMSLSKLIYKMSTKPQEIIGMKIIDFDRGVRPDLVMIDIEKKYRIDKNKFISKGKNTPFHNAEVYGRVELTMHKGEITWQK